MDEIVQLECCFLEGLQNVSDCSDTKMNADGNTETTTAAMEVRDDNLQVLNCVLLQPLLFGAESRAKLPI